MKHKKLRHSDLVLIYYEDNFDVCQTYRNALLLSTVIVNHVLQNVYCMRCTQQETERKNGIAQYNDEFKSRCFHLHQQEI